MRNEIVRERCCLKEDVVSKVEKSMLRWFGYVERMSERRLTKEIYMADVSGNAVRGRPKKTCPDLIGEVLQKGRLCSTRNRRAYMTRCMNVDEAKGVCKDRSGWRSVFSTYPHGEKGVSLGMYLRMYETTFNTIWA